jgi:hypothetical protein
MGMPGSRKGRPNKTTAEVKKAISFVYKKLGGDKAFLAWAEANPDIYYEKILTKLLPLEVKGNVSVSLSPATLIEEVAKRRGR